MRRVRKRTESLNTHRLYQKDTKKYQTGKRQAMMECMVSGSRNSQTCTINEPMPTCTSRTRKMARGKITLIQNYQAKEPLKTTIDP